MEDQIKYVADDLLEMLTAARNEAFADAAKEGGRSEKGRRLAIAATEAEKLKVWIDHVFEVL